MISFFCNTSIVNELARQKWKKQWYRRFFWSAWNGREFQSKQTRFVCLRGPETYVGLHLSAKLNSSGRGLESLRCCFNCHEDYVACVLASGDHLPNCFTHTGGQPGSRHRRPAISWWQRQARACKLDLDAPMSLPVRSWLDDVAEKVSIDDESEGKLFTMKKQQGWKKYRKPSDVCCWKAVRGAARGKT